MEDRLAVGIDLGATQIKACLIALDPRTSATHLRHNLQRPTLDGEFSGQMPRWATTIRDLVRDLEQEVGELTTIGLCAPGLATPDGRCIACMPDRLRGIEGLDWTSHLGRSRLVPVLNDGHASLLGEVIAGAARGLRNVYLLTLGTGVGGAAMVDGQLLKGHLGRAGHLGHLSLNLDGGPDITRIPGSLEDFVGDHSIARRSAGRFSSTRALVDVVAAQDAGATAIWRRSIRALAVAIASLNNILDPEAVLLGGGMLAAGDRLFVPLREELENCEWRPTGRAVPVIPAQLGEWAGAWGAAFNALQHPS